MDAPDAELAEHRALVKRIANEVVAEFGAKSELDDLLQSGFEALLRAKESFDRNKAVPFAAFAYRGIRGAMIDVIRKNGRLSRSALARCRRAERIAATLEAATEEVAVRPPTGDMEAVGAISALLGKATASYVADVTASVERHGTEEGLITHVDSGKVRDAIMTLPEVEREVVLALYWEDRRLAEIGVGKERSESWASRVHTAALGLLREALS